MISSNNDTYKPKVSVIIPVYNVKQYLAEALDSVINQTYKNLEIIVVDDGSNDGSEIICEEFAQKDSRIKLIHRENGGLSTARNTGLDSMTGEYVAFLDSDDVFLTEAIEKSLNALLSNDVDCVNFQHGIYRTISNKIFKNKKTYSLIPEGIYTRLEALELVANYKVTFAVWNKLYKREIWDNIRYPEGRVYEDLYMLFKIIDKVKNIYFMNDILLLYRIRPDSITNTYSIENIKNLLDSLSVFENFVESKIPEIFSKGQLQETQKKILTDLLIYYAKFLSKSFADKSEGLKLMKEKINNMEQKVKIKNCIPEVKLTYYMIFNYPIIISLFFKPCYLIYECIKKNIRFFEK
ncbi:glycosyltransferase family 2 protein [bacterium]|nr:glycosyltransferase family 2 protein [bacterium]